MGKWVISLFAILKMQSKVNLRYLLKDYKPVDGNTKNTLFIGINYFSKQFNEEWH